MNAVRLSHHCVVRLPLRVQCLLCLFVCPADMHRVHHSGGRRETDSKFGFNLPWWDRLFRTYRAQPAAGHDGMTVGIDQFRDPRELWLDRMLLQPLRGEPPATARRGFTS